MTNTSYSLLSSYSLYSPKQKRTWSVFVFVAFMLSFCFMLWRAQFGFASFDESFYLSVPYRFTQGAAPFVDEWHGSQLAGFLLYPLMKLFLAISPNGDGMVLAFRYFYVIVASLVCIYIYLKTRKFSAPAALVASLMLMIFAPYSIRALSYNSMGLLFVSAACFSAADTEHRNKSMMACGLFFAAAVLCCPYLIVIFLLYCLSLPIALVIAKKKNYKFFEQIYALSVPGFVSFCIGAAIVFVVFCIFLFSRTGIKEILQNIPYILNDPEHGSSDFLYDCKRYFGAFFRINSNAPKAIFACVVLLSILALDKFRQKRRCVYMLAAFFIALFYIEDNFSNFNVNFAMLPLCIPGFVAFTLCKNKLWNIFAQVFVPGILYSVCMHFTSNQWYLAICYALAVSSAASVFFIIQLAKEIVSDNSDRKLKSSLIVVALAAILIAQLTTQVYSSTLHVDYEPAIKHLDQRIDSGIQKGVLTTADKAERYYKVMADTQEIRNKDGDYVLYLSDDIWLTLSDQTPTAAFSAWLGFEAPQLAAQRILEYWTLYPEKLPENIYIKGEFYYGYRESFYGEQLLEFFEPLGYETALGSTGYFLSRTK